VRAAWTARYADRHAWRAAHDDAGSLRPRCAAL